MAEIFDIDPQAERTFWFPVQIPDADRNSGRLIKKEIKLLFIWADGDALEASISRQRENLERIVKFSEAEAEKGETDPTLRGAKLMLEDEPLSVAKMVEDVLDWCRDWQGVAIKGDKSWTPENVEAFIRAVPLAYGAISSTRAALMAGRDPKKST